MNVPSREQLLPKPTKDGYLEYRRDARAATNVPRKLPFVRKMVSELVRVVVFDPNDYSTFWRIFTRHCEEKKKSLKLYSRQIAEDAWLLIPQDAADAPPPRFLINEITYTRWGRYKMYAARLEAGETLCLDEEEAYRTKVAWERYGKRNNGAKCQMTQSGKKMLLSISAG